MGLGFPGVVRFLQGNGGHEAGRTSPDWYSHAGIRILGRARIAAAHPADGIRNSLADFVEHFGVDAFVCFPLYSTCYYRE
jgi:hypothetical protein